MSSQTLWKGMLHFDGSFVPVKLHSAVKEERIRFNLLHRTDGVRLQQRMVCALEKTPVPAGEQVKGFEVGEGRYVILSPEEFEEFTPEASRLIEVHEFVGRGEIPPLFFERGYNLEPDGAENGYGELLEVLKEKEVAGVCTWTMRKRSYFGALLAGSGALRLYALRHGGEVAGAGELGLGDIPVTEREVSIGSELIDRLTAPFEPEKYRNEHEVKLRELLAKKAAGGKVELLRPKLLAPTPPETLLEALEASLGRVA